MDLVYLQTTIENAWQEPSLRLTRECITAVETVIEMLDSGQLRSAEKIEGQWQVNTWIKKAILLYFQQRKVEPMEGGNQIFYDKIPLKSNFLSQKVRVVPPATCRKGAYLGKQVVLMPSFINIGAYVDDETMIDTWATVGSCAQIGKRVHISGGVGIGGVLEPPQARPVIIEDDVFVGSRCIIVEGVIVEEKAVLGANVTLTASTAIWDVTQPEPLRYVARVPANSVVIPGTYEKEFPAGKFGISCALIIGKRKESTDIKTSLNETLRIYEIIV
ncbi:MAG: 2,3,4,5-tetrahydropyridine-2,6-dicarboxylate N-succinyltransferase [Bacteroidia bacterium]|nr:2,3,4,5-tetrahydropyridine-2,6-dicarboxylate N-succinyltransferase [Bacteroidia bacterium]MDW8158820.1 2,3,4,5-tetrahydropyridine-2,6-dicarboxylate N-succinyltransferase [Bacteroidia bacterium]